MHIAIIGAGQLGSRHLQALARSPLPTHITVVDPSEESLSIAKARWQEAGGNASVSYQTAVPAGAHYGFAVVATCSGVRALATRGLFDNARVDNVLFEKFLFPLPEEYDGVRRLLKTKGARAWVNCPRRMYPIYNDLQPLFKGSAMSLHVAGGDWGLGCNAVHFADLAAYLSGAEGFAFNAAGLDPVVHDAPRRGYVEFTGLLTGAAGSGDQRRFAKTATLDGADRNAKGPRPVVRVTLESMHGSHSPHLIHILGPHARAVIDETRGKGWLTREDNGWQTEELDFRLPYQSELTHVALEAIARDGDCQLPGYDESASLHLALLDALGAHMRKHGHACNGCPVT